MPLYDYQCRSCGARFEMFRRMQDADRKQECPECRSENIERLLSSFATRGCGTSGSGRFT
jgi:putative FmdB family regulatory protein